MVVITINVDESSRYLVCERGVPSVRVPIEAIHRSLGRFLGASCLNARKPDPHHGKAMHRVRAWLLGRFGQAQLYELGPGCCITGKAAAEVAALNYSLWNEPAAVIHCSQDSRNSAAEVARQFALATI
jgi:hypothetical protein